MTSEEFINQFAEKLQAIGTLHGIGETWVSIDGSVPAGGVPYCGQAVPRAMYADLFAWATAQGKVKTESEWQAHAAANGGNCPFYSDGDGSTTFRMPCVSSYLKGATSASKAGQYKAPALPNIRGAFNANQLQDGTECASGALVVGGAEARVTPVSTSDDSQNGFSFDASKYDPIYQDGADVTPETYTVLIGVYAFSIATNVGGTDVGNVASAVAQAQTEIGDIQTVLPLMQAEIEEIAAKSMMPNYSSYVQVSKGDFTPTYNGWIRLFLSASSDYRSFTVKHKESNQVILNYAQARYPGSGWFMCPLVAGETYTIASSESEIYFHPMR